MNSRGRSDDGRPVQGDERDLPAGNIYKRCGMLWTSRLLPSTTFTSAKQSALAGLSAPEHCGLRLRDQPHGLVLQRRRHLLRLGQLARGPPQLRPEQRDGGDGLCRVAGQGRCCCGWCGTRSTRSTGCPCPKMVEDLALDTLNNNIFIIERPASPHLARMIGSNLVLCPPSAVVQVEDKYWAVSLSLVRRRKGAISLVSPPEPTVRLGKDEEGL